MAQHSIVVIICCENVVDNVVNVANRANVNHRVTVPPDTIQQQRAAPATVSMGRADVTLKRLPFYDVLADIMKPSSLGVPCRLSLKLELFQT